MKANEKFYYVAHPEKAKLCIQNSFTAMIGFNTFRQVTAVNHPNGQKTIYGMEQTYMQIWIIDVVKEFFFNTYS